MTLWVRFRNSTSARILVLFCLALLCLAPTYDHVTMNIYQGRDIRRAAELLRGHWIWYGPDLSGGGHTPGPFYYYLLAIPYALFGTWESIVWFELGLAAGAAVLLFFLGETLLSSFAGFLIYFLFLGSTFFRSFLMMFWNPSFLYFFQALLLLIFPGILRSRNRLLVFGLILGLTLQIHYTQLIFLVGAIATIARARGPRAKKLRNLGTLTLGILIPLLPFLIWSLGAEKIASHSFTSAVQTLMRPILFVASSHPGELAERFIPNIKELYSTVLSRDRWLLGLAVLWLFVCFSSTTRRKVPFLDPFFWSCFLVSCVSLLSPVYEQPLVRYLSPLFLFGYVTSLAPLVWLEKSHRWIFLGWVFLLILQVNIPAMVVTGLTLQGAAFVLLGLTTLVLFPLPKGQRWSLIALLLLAFATFQASLWPRHMRARPEDRTVRERKRFLAEIISKTHWNYEYFREHAFIVGLHRESEYEVPYRQLLATESPDQPVSYDGLFAIRRSLVKFLPPGSDPDWDAVKEWIPKQLHRAGMRKRITCELTESFEDFDICYYRFAGIAGKMTWNDLGYSYQYQQPPLAPIRERRHSEMTGKGHWLFYSNPCENHEPACTTYFLVDIRPTPWGDTVWVTALGDPLAVPNPAPNPANVMLLRDVQMSISCGKTDHKFDVASLLGIEMTESGRFEYGFLAPYQIRFPSPCSSPQAVTISARAGSSASAYGTWTEDLDHFSLRWP